jgi:hypothetical protein
MVFIYLVNLTIPFWLADYYAIPLLDLGKITEYRPIWAYRFTGGFVALFVFYGFAWGLARATALGPREKLTIVGFGVVFQVLALLAYHIGAIDIYDYLGHARTVAVYGANPFISAPSAFQGDPYFGYVGWWWLTMTYGPLWVLATVPGAWVSELSGLLAAMVYYKALAILLTLATAWLIHLTLLRRGVSRPWAGTLLFLWNPLVVFEGANNAHNDVMLVFFLVASFFFLAQRGSTAGSFISLSAASLTKFVTAPLFAPLALAILRDPSRGPIAHRAATVAVGTALAGLLAVALYIPFWEGRQTLGFLQQIDLFTTSPAVVLARALEGRWGWEDAASFARRLSAVVFAVGSLVILLAFARKQRPAFESFSLASYEVLFLLIVVGLTWMKPWYILWLLAIAPFTLDPKREVRAIVFALGGMLNYTVFTYAGPINGDRFSVLEMEIMATGVTLLPPLFVTALFYGPRLGGFLPAVRRRMPQYVS